MKITMIGTGYVGLVSGACFADFGHEVTCIDKDHEKIDGLRAGKMPIYEPGLDVLVSSNTEQGRLKFSTNPTSAVADCDAVFIAVGTPSRRGDGHADLSYVYAAAEEIADLMQGFTVVVTKSTVPVGTGDGVERIIRERQSGAEFAVVSNPEFLREGAAINDFKHPDRVVVGVEDDRAGEVMREIYRPLFLNETPIVMTRRRTSELIKYTGNAFLATKISFINEIADLCEAVGANVQEVARGIGLDNRIGSKFLNAGPGYGGSCFPKDTLALVRTANDAHSPLTIVEAVVDANERRKRHMGERVEKMLAGSAKGRKIALLGLAFKPNTDDMREAPALEIISYLKEKGAFIRGYDPESMQEAAKMVGDKVEFAQDAYDCIENADVMVIVTEWNQFRALDMQRVKAALAHPNILDLRNIYQPDEMRGLGFNYASIGR